LTVYYYALFYRAPPPSPQLPLDCYWELAGTVKALALQTGYFADKMFNTWTDPFVRIEDGQSDSG